VQSQKPTKRHFELPPTFFYESLLKVDPFDLRDNLFHGRLGSDGWQLIEKLLFVIEEEARKICPDADPFINQPEDVYLYFHCGDSSLNHREANAVAALRSIAVIRRLFALDPWEHNYDSPTVARIALEVMALIMAAIRGDFLGEYAKLIERGASALHGSRKPRADNLNKAIIQKLKSGGIKQSTREILAALEKDKFTDPNHVVGEVYGKEIQWFDERGVIRETNYRAFEKRVSKLRKRFQ